MRIDDLRLLYDYNYWANGKILEAATRLDPSRFVSPLLEGQPSIRTTLLHALDAEFGWRLYLQHERASPVLEEEDFSTIEPLVARWREEEREMRAYLALLTDQDLNEIKRYTSESGQPRERRLWQALLHVVNHGTQHRSEVALMLTLAGLSPGELDFTVFLSEQERGD